MEPSVLSSTEFLDFPSEAEILTLLEGLDSTSEDLGGLFRSIAGRLGARTYERSAAAFLLIESIYDYQDVVGRELSYLLPRCVFALTGDRDLALSALSAFNEIHDALRLQGPMVVEPEPDRIDDPGLDAARAQDAHDAAVLDDTVPVPPPITNESGSGHSRADEALAELQVAQKEVADAGLSARISLDLSARRPTPERLRRTQQDLDLLRASLAGFSRLIESAEVELLGDLSSRDESETGS